MLRKMSVFFYQLKKRRKKTGNLYPTPKPVKIRPAKNDGCV
jgi:hypothetical protein